MNRNVPNALTLARVLVIPFFIYCLFAAKSESRMLISLLIFVLASITDYLDGALARKYNLISNFGKIMDPLADKLLVISALAWICFADPFSLSIFIFILIVLREVVITILREVYKKKGIIVAADKLGKLKTVTQMLGIIAALGIWSLNAVTPSVITGISLWFWLVTALTIISGINYLFPKSTK